MIATDNTKVVAYFNKQGWTHSQTSFTSSSGSVPMATYSRHRAKHIPGCLNVIGLADCLSQSHLPQFMSPILEPRALVIEALSQDWQGRLMNMFPPFPLLSKVIQKLRTTQEGKVASTFTTSVCGPPSLLSIPPGPTLTTGICLGRQVIPSAHMVALMQHYQATGFSKEVSRLAAAPKTPSTNRMYDDRWLCFAHWAAGQGIVPLCPFSIQIAAFLCYLFNTHGLSPCHLKLLKDKFLLSLSS